MIMFKNMKKKVVLATLVALALGNAMSVSAADQVNNIVYAGYVMKTEDLTAYALHKTTLGDGTNKVHALTSGVSLCSWINNYLGMQVTEKAYYNSLGTYSMEFTTGAITIERPGGHLSTTMTISTQWFEFDTAYTAGEWSPDPF